MKLIERVSKGHMSPGQDLVIASYIALEGICAILKFREEELSDHFSRDFLEAVKALKEHQILTPPDWMELGATEWEESGEGGIMATLWILSGAYETGFDIMLKRIPVRQESIEICEFYDLNPYRLQSKGCYLLTADNGGDLVRRLEEKQIPAVVIGKVDTGIKRQIRSGDGRSFLDRPKADELSKIVPQYYKNKTN